MVVESDFGILSRKNDDVWACQWDINGICSVGDIPTSATKKLLTWMLIQLPHFSAGSFASFWAKEVDAIFEKLPALKEWYCPYTHTYDTFVCMYVRTCIHGYGIYIDNNTYIDRYIDRYLARDIEA
jgi:hypothetical protein